MSTSLYDEFSTDYDRFVDWQGRLAYEMGFIEAQLAAVGAQRVLDAACGTGMHAIALGRRGYHVVGADASAGMIERARGNAAAAGAEVRFVVAGFGEMAAKAGRDFEALLCLGNSLPHASTPTDLKAALSDFAACLRPDGLLLVQNRNFDQVLAQRQRWMPLQEHREGDAEWLFLRFYDFDADGLLTFHIVTLYRQGTGSWQQRMKATRLWPLRQAELTAALEAADFNRFVCWGDMEGHVFDPAQSSNLIITARKNRPGYE